MTLISVFFEYIGFIALVYLLLKCMLNIYHCLYFYDQIDFKSTGSWAVISGGSDGIGLAYANELAQRGLNLVLISNKQNDLDKVSLSLTQTYKVTILDDLSYIYKSF